jgi:hypothetical protein
MNQVLDLRKMLWIVPILALGLMRAQAQIQPFDQIKSQAELDKTVGALDAALFDAYNHCDLEKFGSFISDDVEFYHDQGGVTLGKANLVDSVKKNICGKTARELRVACRSTT